MNEVRLYGRLGKDPELRNADSGTAVCSMNVATSGRKKNAAGEWEETTEWHRVVCFGTTASNCSRYLAKGREVIIQGELRTRQWEKDGEKRWMTEVIAHRVTFVGAKPEQAEGGGGYNGGGGGGGGASYGAGSYGGGDGYGDY